jgi:hypothetical protein
MLEPGNTGVIPDKRRSRADPGSIIEHRRALRWIPELRFATSGMTSFFIRQVAEL